MTLGGFIAENMQKINKTEEEECVKKSENTIKTAMVDIVGVDVILTHIDDSGWFYS